MRKWAALIFFWVAATFNSQDQLADYMNKQSVKPQAGMTFVMMHPSGLFNLVYWKD